MGAEGKSQLEVILGFGRGKSSTRRARHEVLDVQCNSTARTSYQTGGDNIQGEILKSQGCPEGGRFC